MSRFDLQSVTKRVLARAQRFADRGDNSSWDDLLRNNFLGVIGEDAVEIYLRDCGFEVESWAEDWIEGGVEIGDLAVMTDDHLLLIEVKTNGRTTPRTHLDTTRSDFIVWCRASPPKLLDPSQWQIPSAGVRLTHWAEAAINWAAGPDQPMSELRGGLKNPLSRPSADPFGLTETTAADDNPD